jgi:hypothetical protein
VDRLEAMQKVWMGFSQRERRILVAYYVGRHPEEAICSQSGITPEALLELRRKARSQFARYLHDEEAGDAR